MELCIICDKLGSSSGSSTNLGDVKKITRGISTLRAASIERKDGLDQFLQSEFTYAHEICRKKYTHKKYIELQQKEAKKISVVSTKKEIARGYFNNFVDIIIVQLEQ